MIINRKDSSCSFEGQFENTSLAKPSRPEEQNRHLPFFFYQYTPASLQTRNDPICRANCSEIASISRHSNLSLSLSRNLIKLHLHLRRGSKQLKNTGARNSEAYAKMFRTVKIPKEEEEHCLTDGGRKRGSRREKKLKRERIPKKREEEIRDRQRENC